MSGKNQNRPGAAGGGAGWHGGGRRGGGCISECEVHLFGWGEGGRRYRVPMPESWKF